MPSLLRVAAAAVICCGFGDAPDAAAAPQPPADLILHGGRVYTVDTARPEARAVAVRGDRIVKVGSEAEVLALRGPQTSMIDLRGRLLLPGFTDAHTHFENAADWVTKVSLFDVADESELLRRLAAAAARVPEGLWITGGELGAYRAWDAESKGQPAPAPPAVRLAEIDRVTPRHAVLLRRADGAFIANSEAFRRARWNRRTPDPRGGRIERDPATGEPTGVLFGRAGERIQELMPPPNLEQKLVGARAALRDLARVGITGIHDVARLDAASQRQLFHTFVERSSSNLEIFRELQRRGELSARVYAILSLPLCEATVAAGIRARGEEGLIRFGAMKGYVDGYLMEQPYADNPAFSGDFTFRFTSEEEMARQVACADRNGFDPVVHATGDKAHRLLLDWYEAAIRSNPPRDRRFRLIHAWYFSRADIARAGRLGLIADITPEQLMRRARMVDRQLGPERAKTAFAWRQLIQAGVRVNLVADWPGSYNEQEHTPLAPLENIALAVLRRPLAGGTPWHPEEALSVAEAVAAYTINPAYASYEEGRRGSVSEGKLADLVVLSKDILTVPREEIASAEVELTILGGKVIYRRQ
ncbi:MAG: amidohydrolase [Vicinamibacteria bacterium]